MFRLFLLLDGGHWLVQRLLQFVRVYGFIPLDCFGTFGIDVLMVCWCREAALWSKQGCVFGLEDWNCATISCYAYLFALEILCHLVAYVFWTVELMCVVFYVLMSYERCIRTSVDFFCFMFWWRFLWGEWL